MSFLRTKVVSVAVQHSQRRFLTNSSLDHQCWSFCWNKPRFTQLLKRNPSALTQLQSTNRFYSGDSTSSPPSPPSNGQSIWIGAAAAALLGGGAYYVYNSMSENSKSSKDASKPARPTKPKIPPTSSEIPKEVPYLLIGGGTASFAAFRAIKSQDPKAKVMVLTDEMETPYMRPPLSKELWLAAVQPTQSVDTPKTTAKDTNQSDGRPLTFKQWNGVERSLHYEPNEFYMDPTKLADAPNGGVSIVRGYTVKKIDAENRIATLDDGTEIKYRECLIATGSSPKNLPVFEKAAAKVQEHISMFKTIEDYWHLRSKVDQAKSVAIIGGGFLGSELACALTKYGQSRQLQVHQIIQENGNMSKVLPEFLSKWTTERVREEGVDVIPNAEVNKVELVDNRVQLTLQNGQTLSVDHVVVAVGSQPDTSLGKVSGLEIEQNHGGYLVNAEMAARNHLYVAGDAACFYDPKFGRRRVEHHDHAVVSGRLAGENMTGSAKPYKHQSMFWSDLGPKVGYEALGIIDSTLPTVSVFAKKAPGDSAPKSDSHATNTKPNSQAENKPSTPTSSSENEDFSKGVVFYLRDKKIVGIVLWNVFNRINTARALLSQDKIYDDLNEVAKLFDIHL